MQELRKRKNINLGEINVENKCKGTIFFLKYKNSFLLFLGLLDIFVFMIGNELLL